MSSQYIDLPVEGGGSGVSSLNSLTGAITLIAGSNITITPSGSNITISTTAAASPFEQTGGVGSPIHQVDTTAHLELAQTIEDTTNLASIDTNNRNLIFTDGTSAVVQWANLQLVDSSGTLSVDWGSHQLLDDTATLSIDFAQHDLYDIAGHLSAEYSVRDLKDYNSNTALHWEDRLLYGNDGATVYMDWTGNYDSSAFASFGTELLGNPAIFFQGVIADNSGYTLLSIDPNNRILNAANTQKTILDWTNVYNSSAFLSFNAGNAVFSGAITVAGTIQATVSSENYTLSPGWGSTVTGTTTATIDFNAQNASCVQLSLTASDNCVLTISNVVPGGAYVIKVLNASGATVGWPSSFDWGAAGAPTLSASGLYDDVHLLVQQSTSNIHAYVSKGFSS